MLAEKPSLRAAGEHADCIEDFLMGGVVWTVKDSVGSGSGCS